MAYEVSNSISKKKHSPITEYLKRIDVKEKVSRVIKPGDEAEFVSGILSATINNPQLQECTNASIVNAALLGYSLKLSPSPQLGQYYMVPYKDQAVFQIGYRGMVQLAIRSGQYKKLNAMAVKEGELVGYDPVREEIQLKIIPDEKARESAKTIGYYAYYELINGFTKSLYWSHDKMEAHALKYSQGYKKKTGYTFWEKDFDGMAIKTMYRQLLKLAPCSVEMTKAYISDQAVIKDNGQPDYVDNEPEDEPAEEAPAKKEEAPKQEQPKEPEQPAQTEITEEDEVF